MRRVAINGVSRYNVHQRLLSQGLRRTFLGSRYCKRELSQESPKPTSQHLIYYRDFLPPTIKILLWASIVYVGLNVLAVSLEYEEYKLDSDKKVKALEERINELEIARKELREKRPDESSNKARWWKWIGL